MQEIINTEFKRQTVITVTHRYTHIQRFNRVLVMSQGELVESGRPHTLLGDQQSAFWSLYHGTSRCLPYDRAELM